MKKLLKTTLIIIRAFTLTAWANEQYLRDTMTAFKDHLDGTTIGDSVARMS